jgi:hypothetical protein
VWRWAPSGAPVRMLVGDPGGAQAGDAHSARRAGRSRGGGGGLKYSLDQKTSGQR